MTGVRMTRWKAAAIHLAISCVVASFAVAIFVFAWFPPPNFSAGGGLRLLRTLVMVDVVLGPLLTLVVYRAGKKGLKFDLVVIGVLQAAALVAGLYMAHKQRPVYIVVTPDRASLVRASDLFYDPPAKAYAKAPWHGIDAVALRMPDGAERSRLVEAIMDGKPDVDFRPAYYLPLPGHLEDVAKKAQAFDARIRAEPKHAACYRAWLAEEGLADPAPLRILPLVGAETDAEVVVDTSAGRLVGYLPDADALRKGCTD